MIEKERLEELIKQGSTIYSTSWKEEIDLSQYWCEVFEMDWDGKIIYKLVVHEDDEHNPMYSLDGLTEDIESAKWEEEFGCIERTIKLDLPKWEEIEKDKHFHYLRLYIINSTKLFIEIYKFTNNIKIEYHTGCKLDDERYNENWKLTKENYTIACRKAKELFLGGSDGDIR